MAKDITEIINEAAVVRDETGEAANTAARVGGSIADLAQYIKEEIITPLLTAQSKAVSAERIAEYAKKIAEEAAGKITASLNKDAEQDTRISTNEKRILNYVYPKIYQLNEGAGAIPFDDKYIGSASVLSGRKTVAEDGFTYKVVFGLQKFLLQEISPSGVTIGLYEEWDKIISGRGSSEDYTRRDCLYYIYAEGEGSTYYYIDSNGVATEQSATYLLRSLIDKNAEAIDALQGNVVGPGGDNSDYGEQIKELGEFDTFLALLAKAAKFYIVSNNAIALLHGTCKKADGIYNGVLILQQVEKNSDGGGTAMQYIYNKNRQFTRSITFSATAVTSVQLPQNDGARNLSLSERVLQMTNMWGENVGDSVTLPDNGNLYEGTAGESSVPVVLAKTFGGTVTAKLSAATSARAGVMTVDHVNKIKKLEERVLQYLYQKIYQLNEGAGAIPFDGKYIGSASVLSGRKTVAEDGFTYKVVFGLQKFLLQEISPGGVTIGLYEEWDKIISGRGSSEDYTRRDCLYYIYAEGEGSTYYYIDSNGVATEQSATYLLRRLVDAQEGKIADANKAAQDAMTAAGNAQSDATDAQEKNAAQDARIDAIENRVQDLSTAGRYWNETFSMSTSKGHYGSLDALRSLPEKLGLGRYLVKDDRTRRKLDPTDSTKYADDGTDAKLDGTDGQCMWCWNGFYANVWKEGDNLFKVVSFDRPVGNDISIWIPAGGISWLGAGVMDRTEQKLCSIISDPALYGPEFDAERYRGGNGSALEESKYTTPQSDSPQITMLGMPATMLSTTQFGEAARKRGLGWEANWFVARFVVEFLFEVIMGTQNSQEQFAGTDNGDGVFIAQKDANGLYHGGFGTGVTNIPNWLKYNGLYPVIPTSVGLEAGDGVCLVDYNLPNASGGTYHTFKVPVFFGLVGAGFGNLWQFVRGIIMDAGEKKSLVYVSPSMYADYKPNIISDKIMVAECPRVSGYIKRKSYRGLCCMPTELGGSQLQYYSDTFYYNPIASNYSNLRVRAAGGSSTDNIPVGASCTLVFSDATEYFSCYSAPLCYFAADPIIP